MNDAQTGAYDDQSSKEAYDDRGPSTDTYRLSQDQRAHDGNHEWRNKSDRDGIGKRNIGDANNEKRCRTGCQNPASNLQFGVSGRQDRPALNTNQHEHAQKQPKLAKPNNLDGMNRVGQKLSHCIDTGEQKHAYRHQGDTAQAVCSSRR